MRKLPRLAHFLIPATAFSMLPGCVTTEKSSHDETEHNQLIAEIPHGWRKRATHDEILLTKDGVLLQLIKINSKEYGEEYENTDLTIQPGMMTLDAAQIIVENLQADLDRGNLEILDNQPVEVAGFPGFRIEITYKNENNLTIHEIIYVALTPDNYVVALCRAPARYYMETISGDFEEIVANLEIIPPPAPEPVTQPEEVVLEIPESS